MNNFLHTYPIQHGQRLSLPDGYLSRAVVDAMGTPTLHVELFGGETTRRDYVVQELRGSGVVRQDAHYLGHIVESFGSVVRHFYAVPA